MIEYCIKDQDATIGNILSKQLNKDPRVKFCCFHKKHPFDQDINLILDVHNEELKTVLNENIDNLIHILKTLHDSLK